MANDIVCENSKPGNPPSDWTVTDVGDTSIQGFATDISVPQGGTISFKILTDAKAYTIGIFRIGYYAGNGARQVATVTPSAPLPQTQPACLTDATTYLYDCGNWAVSASWTVPSNAVSGLYVAVLIRTDTGGASQIFFVVRNDTSHSAILYQTSDETWQAYNDYGGHSLYGGAGTWDLPDRAYKVSYNRPFDTRNFEAATWLFNAEYPMIRWMEANGYDVTYSTGIDAARNGSLILNHKVYLTAGHDEYWSGPQRTNVEAARNAGVNMAFFTGNEVFWKTRWENSTDGSNTPYRTLVCYKETLANAVIDPLDPPTWTGTWRDPRFSPPADGGKPENELNGTIFAVNGPGTDNTGLSILVPAADTKLRFWRNTSIANLPSGQTATLPPGTLGYEWDIDSDNGSRPAGLMDLTHATYTLTTDLLLDYGGVYGGGSATHSSTLYRASSGALVFGVGTVQWSWGLDSNHDNSFGFSTPNPDPDMQQATVNLLADMGVQPGTLQAGLVQATQSTDTTPPVSVITSPANGANLQLGNTITISGTASDSGGGVVAGVEVSTDGGATWHPAVGRESWTYTWTILNSGSLNLKSRAVDDSANLETPSAGVTVTVPKAAVSTDVNISADGSTASSTIKTAAFSTTVVNELLLAFISTDYLGGANTTVTGVSGGGLTWVLVVRANGQSGTSEIWRAFAPTPLSNISVTATLSQSVVSSITVLSFTGVNTSGTNGSGAIGATKSASVASGAPTATLVTTHNNSLVFGVGNDFDNAIARTPGPGQSLVHQLLTSTGDTYWVQMENAPVSLSGTSVTINDTAPTGDRYNLAICEILAGAGQTFSLSGNISPAASGNGAVLYLTGSATATVAADASGNYSFANLANGVYTATPKKVGYSFTPPSQSVTIDGASASAINFTASALPTFTVSGSISPSASGSGATVTLTSVGDAGTNATVTADSSGNFSFPSVLNATYSVTPSKTGFSFSPSSQSVTVNGANLSGITFTASAVPTYSISGTVSGAVVSGVTLSLSGVSTASTTSDSSGNYTFASLANGAYTVTPAKTGYTFTPANLAATVNGANVTGVNFSSTAVPTYSISGTVSGAVVSGVTLSLSGAATASTTSDSSGNYTFSALANGAYTVTPSSTGYTFTPANQPETVNNANISAVNFTSQAVVQYATLAIDANASTLGAKAATVSSPSFSTTTGNELLLAFIATDYLSGTNTTVTGVSGAGLTWVLVARANSQSGTSEIWRAFASNPLLNVTATATLSQSVISSITVLSFTGVDTTGTNGSGAIGATKTAGAAKAAPTATLVTTRNNSWVFGVGNDYDNATARTLGANQSLVQQYLTSAGDTYWVQRQNATTPLSGTSVTINDTAPTGDRYNLAIVEVLPSTGSQSQMWSISGNISPVAGGSGATVTLSGASSATTTADASGDYAFNNLANGSYTVTPSESGYSFSPTNLPATVNGASATGLNFTATALAPVLSVSSTGVYFSADQGGSNPPPSSVSVTNTGGGSLTFTTSSDSTWLTATPASGSAPQAVQLSVNITGLAIGTYTGHVTITSTGTQGSPATVTVTLNVGVATDWLTVDHDSARTGNALDETTLTPSNVSGLQLTWSEKLDGNITAQPLFVHSILIADQTRDVLIIGTGGNSIYALDASNGTVLWSRNFGAPTPNTWGLPDGFGIEAPPFIDRIAGRIYTVSTDGSFRTISLFDGTDVYPALTLIANPVTNKVWGGLNRVGNSIYVASASNGGDVAPWRGQVYQVNVASTPTLAGDFVVVPSIPAPNGGGGIWGYGGVSADLANGDIFASTSFDSNVSGNGNENTAPYSNGMVALNSNVNLLGFFQGPQPSSIPCDGAPCDLDFASTPTVFQPAGCPTMLAAGSKNGNLYLFREADLIASAPPLQILALNAPNDSLGSGGVGGVAAWSPVDNMLYITDAGPGVTGVAAGVVGLKVTSACTLQVAWSNALGGNDTPNSTPTIANGIVFVGQGNSGVVHAYNSQTGAQLWQSGSNYAVGATFAAPTVAGGKLYTGSWTSLASGGGTVGAFSLPVTTPVLSVSPQVLSFNAVAGGNNPAPASFNIANSGAGTLTFTTSSDSAWLTASPSSGTAPQSVQVSASITGLASGTYTGHITVTATGATGSPSVLTVTLNIGASTGLAMDAKVFKDSNTASTSIATAAFSTTAANELLLAFVSADFLSGTNTSVTAVSGGGLTWALVVRTNTQKGTSEIWRAFAPTVLTNVTVTASLSQSVAASMTVISFSGVDSTGTNGSGAIGATKSANAATGAPTATLVSTRNNSWVFGVGNDYDNAIARTPGTGQTVVHQLLSTAGDTYWVQMQSAPTPLSGTSVTINDTAPTGDRYNLSICEVLPAQ
jgi:hypothetical protein